MRLSYGGWRFAFLSFAVPGYFNATVGVSETNDNTKATQHSKYSNTTQGKSCNKKVRTNVINR
ncbi:exported hypothetical protein [Candidatus Nitrotoga sp. BS]|nr:exported hypothetical protein [Candidatus Nitrotoga sp. BS]